MKALVIYHKADFDGLFCREIARKVFGEEAVYMGWDYGDPLPEIGPLERRVYMLDISVDGLMTHPNLVWIDHHKSAIVKYPSSIPGYRIDGVAACRLAFQWFRNKTPGKADYVERHVDEPYAVRLAGEYDVWDKRDFNVDTFQAALRAQPLTPLIWARLLSEDSEDTVRAMLPLGRAVQYAAAQANASLMRDASFELEWEGLRWLALNKPRANSLTFEAGLQPQHDALLSFYWLRNKWRVSLYGAPSHPEHDLSTIATQYGGGGHRQACGFECQMLPFALGQS